MSDQASASFYDCRMRYRRTKILMPLYFLLTYRFGDFSSALPPPGRLFSLAPFRESFSRARGYMQRGLDAIAIPLCLFARTHDTAARYARCHASRIHFLGRAAPRPPGHRPPRSAGRRLFEPLAFREMPLFLAVPVRNFSAPPRQLRRIGPHDAGACFTWTQHDGIFPCRIRCIS